MTIIRHAGTTRGGATPATLKERLATLEAAEAARVVMAKYADAVDQQDVSAISGLLAPDVVLSVGPMIIEGFDAVVDFFRNAFVDDPSRKSHFVTNVATHWLGDGNVHIDAYFLWTAGSDTQSIIGWGTYSDRAKISNGSALLTRIEIAIRHMGEVGDGWMFGAEGGSA